MTAPSGEELRALFDAWAELAHLCGEAFADGDEQERRDAVKACAAKKQELWEHIAGLLEDQRRLAAMPDIIRTGKLVPYLGHFAIKESATKRTTAVTEYRTLREVIDAALAASLPTPDPSETR